MAQKTGTIKSCSRQGSGGTQTLQVILTVMEANPSPPPPELPVDYEFIPDENYYDDAVGADSRQVTITYDGSASPPQNIDGLKIVN